MQVKKYSFGDCKIEIRSENEIITEGNYSRFLDDFETPDFIINVFKVNVLPDKIGECVFKNDEGSLYYGAASRKYKACFDSKSKRYFDYSCFENNKDLYINYPGDITEFIVFEGIDLVSLLLQKGIGVLHCSYIEFEDEAILFAGDKQVGKSTQAALWEEYKGVTVLNGDRAGVFEDNGKIYACGVPYCGTSGICHNKKLPVKAIVALSKGSENVVSKPSPFESVMFIAGRFSHNYWDELTAEMTFAIAENICKNTTVLSYSCLKDETAVNFLEDVLKREA